MRSTGEVMGVGPDFPAAFDKAFLAAGDIIPTSGKVLVSLRTLDRGRLVELGQRLINQGFEIVATRTNQEILKQAGLECTMVNKVSEGSPHIVDAIKNDEISLIINSTDDSQGLEDASVIRCQALIHKIPCTTTVAAAFAMLDGLMSSKQARSSIFTIYSQIIFMDTIPITVSGAKALEVELLRLKDEERPRIVSDIATAREHGDLKENAEYHAAKEEQGFIEGRIQDIGSKLSRLQVIDVRQLNQDGRCVFGTTVKLLNLSDDTETTYQIVGEDEADIELGKISCHSPIANALLGNEEGDEVTVKAPKGDILYEILEVLYI